MQWLETPSKEIYGEVLVTDNENSETYRAEEYKCGRYRFLSITIDVISRLKPDKKPFDTLSSGIYAI